MSVLCRLAAASAEHCGGKAAGLARLIARDLPVPAGSCLPFEVYRGALSGAVDARWRTMTVQDAHAASSVVRERLACWTPNGMQRRALARAAAALGWPLAVRSSASCEGAAGFSAAGVFVSALDVRDLEQLIAAIRRCWISLWSPAAWALLRHAERWPGQEAMAVLLQPMIRAQHSGLALAGDDTVHVELVEGIAEPLARGDADPYTIALPRAAAIVQPAAFPLPRAQLAALRDLVLQAEVAVGGPPEVEWASDGTQLWLLQARPAPPVAGAGADAFALHWQDAADRRRRWRWDREHNPDPLSTAHASLIGRLDAGRGHAKRYIVQGGYLYHACDPVAAQPPAGAPWQAVLHQLARHVQQAEVDVEQPHDPATRLQRALDHFIDFHRLYEEQLGPARQAVHRQLRALLARLFPERSAAARRRLQARLEVGAWHESLQRAAELQAIGRADPAHAQQRLESFLCRFGKLAPVWDVAAPTLGEQPEQLKTTAAALAQTEHDPSVAHRRQRQRSDQLCARLCAALAGAAAAELRAQVEQGRAARASAEDDDALFARSLWLVRCALLRAGEELVARQVLAQRDQVFWLPLHAVERALVHSEAETASLSARADSAQREHLAARRRAPPLLIDGGRPQHAALPRGEVLRGTGIGATVQGHVRCVPEMDQLLTIDLRGAIVVCPTVSPALAVVLPEVVALVTDHGGLLSHAAALARELGIPTVVGTRIGTRVLRDGDLVWVDGNRGCVVRLVPAAPGG